MVKSMFAAVAGLKTHQARMDVISNNIANVNTWGYKARKANFADAMYQNMIKGGGGNNGSGGIGGTNSSQVGFGVNVSSISTDFTAGSWSPTGSGWDCMIDGPSFFVVGSMKREGDKFPNSTVQVGEETMEYIHGDLFEETGLKLSRVGIFTVDDNGYIVDDTGNYVYGYRGDVDGTDAKAVYEAGPKPLRIPDAAGSFTDEGERMTLTSFSIGSDGVLVGIDDKAQPHTIGRLALAAVQNPNGLEQTQGYLYTPGGNAGKITVTAGGTEAVGKVRSGYLEMANVDLANEISTMITTQRGYQANTKMITVTDQMLEELVNMKR